MLDLNLGHQRCQVVSVSIWAVHQQPFVVSKKADFWVDPVVEFKPRKLHVSEGKCWKLVVQEILILFGLVI